MGAGGASAAERAMGRGGRWEPVSVFVNNMSIVQYAGGPESGKVDL